MQIKFPNKLKIVGTTLLRTAVRSAAGSRRAKYVKAAGLSTFVVLVGVLIFVIPKASADTQGPYPATTTAGSWTSVANAKVCDSTYATNAIASAATGVQLSATGYGFTIPAGSTINGIQADVNELATSGTKNKIQDSNVQLIIGGTPTGTNLATATNWPTALTDVPYGGSGTLWGLTPSVAQINASNFGVAITAKNVKTGTGAASETAKIDCINVTITYTPPASTLTQSNYRFYQNQDTLTGGGGGSTPSFDTAAEKNTSSAGISAAWTNFFSVGVNTNRYLVVGVTDLGCNQPISITYANVSMTLIGQNTNNTTGCVFFYGLLAPATGSNALKVTPSASSDVLALVASSWYGVDQTTPYGSFSTNFSNSGSTASLSATTTSGQAVVDFLGGPTTGSSAASANGTLAAYQNSNSVGVTLEAGSSYATAAGTTTSMGWTSLPASKWSESAIGLNGPGSASTLDVGTPIAAQNTAISSPAEGTPFRLRLDIGVATVNLAASGQNFELQYAAMSGGSCSATPSGNFANISSSTPVSYYNDTNLTNGLALADANSVDPTESGTIINQEYLQSGTTTFSNPSAINTSQFGVWDFGLVMYHAIASTTYCLRMANATGAALDTYSQFPAVTTPAAGPTQSSFRFYKNQDATAAGWSEPTASAGITATTGVYGGKMLYFNNKLWYMGGSTTGGYTNSVYCSTDGGATWSDASGVCGTASAGWAARSQFAATVFNGMMWVMGGFNGSTGTRYHDVWCSADGTTWNDSATTGSPLCGTAAAPWTTRQSLQAVTFNNMMWIMGGSGATTDSNDVWCSADGTTWNDSATTGSPLCGTSSAPWAARDGFAAYVFNNEMWVVGGENAHTSTYDHDVWCSADGTTWNDSTSSGSPLCGTSAAPWTARDSAGVAVSPTAMYIMAGENLSGNMKDVWAYSAGGMDVSTPLANQSQPLNLTKYDTTGGTRQNILMSPFRLRWIINNTGGGIASSGASLNLQYAVMVGGSCVATGSSGTWANVTTSTPVQFYTGNTVATNGMALTQDANDPTDGSNTINYQTFNDANAFSNTQSAIYNGQDGLWDFALVLAASPPHSNYCLRAYNTATSAAIASNNTYPEVDVAPTMPQLLRGRGWWNSSGVHEFKDLK